MEASLGEHHQQLVLCALVDGLSHQFAFPIEDEVLGMPST